MERAAYRAGGLPGLELREASSHDGIEVWAMVREIGPGENGFGNQGYDVPYSKFKTYLQQRLEMKAGVNLPDGHVPMTTYWLFAGDTPVGMCKLRHRLTASLRRVGGHIGYCVRPSERGKGYGNALLRLVLMAAAEVGIDEVLVTCNADNLISRKVAEHNGGELEKVDAGVAYYWIGCEGPEN
jgi:predicted acetyltransferase